LTYLDLGENKLSAFTLPAGLSHLSILRVSGNPLTSFSLPLGLTNLTVLFLPNNLLTNLTLPSDLIHLQSLDVGGNPLTRLILPSGLINLSQLVLTGDEIISITLPPDLTSLVELDMAANPVTTVVLSDPLADTNLAETVASLRNQNVSVFTYPLDLRLIPPRQIVGGHFDISTVGPPGVYALLGSADLSTWTELGVATNTVGNARFDDEAPVARQKFYRAQLRGAALPPTNMVFVPPNTFTLGSPVSEIGRSSDEGPQTLVTLSRGFWISKFLVTQREYLALTGSNPSGFPGDLSRPVESVSWFAATNYCELLTQQDLAAGRIPSGSHYRLPTEAEWECAARAGTTTRFYYGDDPNLSGLTNHAWYGANSGFKPRPVGQKEPNAWGLYDMEGNVWEWCQDWYGPYPGGSQTDPQGPASNTIGVKVIRGGAWESSEFDCRSARRSSQGASPFITDFIIGFRVVLAQ
jgi:formylglycine-generating enzyme required for sulfatase activity